jgi:hypothetical protein
MNSIILNIILAINAICLGINSFFPSEHTAQWIIVHCSIISLVTIVMEKEKN